MDNFIKLTGLEFFAYHGVNEDEIKNGQFFYVDAELYFDMSQAIITDNVDDTLNYAKATKCIKKSFTVERCNLIERAASNVCSALLGEFPQLDEVCVTVHKPSAPVSSAKFKDISVTVNKKRGNI